MRFYVVSYPRLSIGVKKLVRPRNETPMKTDTNAKIKGDGMSCRDLQATIGISVSARQFRRYVEAGLIPAKWVKKNANGHFTFHPPANTKWNGLRERIEQWRRLRFERGWDARVRVEGKSKNKFQLFPNIQGTSMAMHRWVRKMWPEILEMEEDKLMDIHFLLQDSANLSWWIERKCGIADKFERIRLKTFRDFI